MNKSIAVQMNQFSLRSIMKFDPWLFDCAGSINNANKPVPLERRRTLSFMRNSDPRSYYDEALLQTIPSFMQAGVNICIAASLRLL